MLGWVYLNRFITPPDDNQTLLWLKLAAGQGHAPARKWLGNIITTAMEWPLINRWRQLTIWPPPSSEMSIPNISWG